MSDQPRPDRPAGDGGQQPPWAVPDGSRPAPASPAEHGPEQPGGPGRGADTQEIPTVGSPTQQIPPASAPVWAQSAPAPGPASSGSTPIGPPAGGPKRRGWVVPAALVTGLVLGGGGIALSQLDDGAAPAAATSTPSSSSTSGLGTNTAPAVDPGSAVAPDWTKTAAAATPSVVSIDVQAASSNGSGQGSGVIVDDQGHVVTNNHVASGAGANASITITLSDQRAYSAKVVGTDPSTDLAVLKMENAKDLKPISFGDSSALAVGQPVMAVGNPLGLSGTVTTGIVSALNRPVRTTAVTTEEQDPWGASQSTGSGLEVFTNAIQTSAAINPGNSGGALVDATGRLIGINSSIASLGASGGGSQSGNIGIGFAIPVNEVTNIAKQLIATGKAEHAYLGVAAPTGIVKDGDGQREAAVVERVYPDTPAAGAGLKRGDAIISLDGTAITGYTSLISQVYGKRVGQTSELEYIRDGKRATTEITFTKRPAESS